LRSGGASNPSGASLRNKDELRATDAPTFGLYGNNDGSKGNISSHALIVQSGDSIHANMTKSSPSLNEDMSEVEVSISYTGTGRRIEPT